MDKIETISNLSDSLAIALWEALCKTRDTYKAKGLSDSTTDGAIINGVIKALTNQMTLVTVLLKSDELPKGDVDLQKEFAATHEALFHDIGNAIQEILARHSGKTVLHVRSERP